MPYISNVIVSKLVSHYKQSLCRPTNFLDNFDIKNLHTYQNLCDSRLKTTRSFRICGIAILCAKSIYWTEFEIYFDE